jgi:hypothetical protein
VQARRCPAEVKLLRESDEVAQAPRREIHNQTIVGSPDNGVSQRGASPVLWR